MEYDKIADTYVSMVEGRLEDIAKPLTVGDRVILRDHNRTTYGQEATVHRIDSDGTIYAGGGNLMVIPYHRKHIQPIQ